MANYQVNHIISSYYNDAVAISNQFFLCMRSILEYLPEDIKKFDMVTRYRPPIMFCDLSFEN